MNRFLSKSIALVALVGVFTLFSTTKSEAAFFTGTIDYVGTHTDDNLDLNLATSSTIDSAIVLLSSGSFVGVGPLLTHASPITYRPAVVPYLPLWSDVGTGISFDLLTLVITDSQHDSLTLEGNGVFKGGGYQDTPGKWIMTLNHAPGGEPTVIGSYSSSSGVVPEPATLALLGLGLAGVAARRRSQKA